MAEVHRELYDDWLIKWGNKDSGDSNIVNSPVAHFRRQQILQFKNDAQNTPGFTMEQTYLFGAQLGTRLNEVRR